MPPTKPTLPVLRRHRGHHADEEGALCSLNSDRLHVRQVDDRVDDRELGLRVALRDLLERGGEAKPTATTTSAPRLRTMRSIACSRWASLRHLELEVGHAGLLLELLGAVVGGLVERLVELAAHVEDDRGLEVLGGRRSRGQRQGERQGAELDPHSPPPRSGAPTVSERPRNATGYRRRAQPGRGAAARRSRSRIASPRPSAGIGMTAMPVGTAAVQLAQHREQVARRLGEVGRRAQVERR